MQSKQVTNQHAHEHSHDHHQLEESPKEYLKFGVLIGALLALSLILATLFEGDTTKTIMRVFMGLFFLTFGIFKLINYQEFITAYSQYDILAKESRTYAMLYPFIEIGLAGMYLSNLLLLPTNVFTFLLMSFSSLGVIRVLIKKNVIMCACLGTIIRLPVSKITLIEDLGMGVMALAMIFM